MKWNEYWFWPEHADGKPWSGRAMIIFVMICFILVESGMGNQRHVDYMLEVVGWEVLLCVLIVLCVALFQKKKSIK